jgi:hypothetical protein
MMIAGTKVQAFHPLMFGVIKEGVVTRHTIVKVEIDFGLLGTHWVHKEHVVRRVK